MLIPISVIHTEDGEEVMVVGPASIITPQISQFEHDIIKYKMLKNNTVAILARNTLSFNKCIGEMYRRHKYKFR